jgi:hypothetical protein
MANGILQVGQGRAVRDGVLGSVLATGPGASYRDGSLGEYMSYGTNGLGGCSSCGTSGLGEGASVLGFDIGTNTILGALIGAAAVYYAIANGHIKV